MAIIVGDVTGPQQRHHPYNISHLVKKIKGYPLKVKSFRNTATNQKLRGEGSIHPSYTTGMNLHVGPRVKKPPFVKTKTSNSKTKVPFTEI